MPIQTFPVTDREQWLEMRRQDVTASDIGAVVNCHPYKTALGLWGEKAGDIPDAGDSPAMRRGRWLEPAVLEAVREMKGWMVEPAGIYARDTENRIGCTPDALVRKGEELPHGILQAKTVSKPIFDADWQDGPPLHYQLQTLTEAMLMGVEWAVLAALVIDTFSVDLFTYDIPRHPEAEKRLIDAVRDFWADVEAGREPKADYNRDYEVLKTLRQPDAKAEPVDLSSDNMMPHLLETRAALSERRRWCEQGIEAIDAEVLDKLAGNQAASLPGWKITYKMQQRKETVIPATEFPVLRITRSKADV